MTTKTQQEHAPHGKRCWCGDYHYTCADCRVDCTAGTAGGPAIEDVHGVTRCWKCDDKEKKRVGHLHGAAPAMFEIVSTLEEWFAKTDTVQGSALIFGDEETLRQKIAKAVAQARVKEGGVKRGR